MVDFSGGTWRSLIDGSEVSAIPDSVLEDFEWGGPLSDRYDGNFRGADIVEDSTLEGDFLVESPDVDEFAFFNDESDGPTTEQGMAYLCWVDIGTDDDTRLSTLMHVNEDDGDLFAYGFRLNEFAGEINIMKQDGGTSDITQGSDWDETLASETTTITQAPATIVFGQNDDGEIRFEHYDDKLIDPEDILDESPDGTVSVNDTTHTSGTIGWVEDAGREGQKMDNYVHLAGFETIFSD